MAHVGIAVRSLEEHLPLYRDVLRLPLVGVEEVPEQKVRVAMFKAGDANIELLEPLGPDSPIASFLEKRGEGLHHIAYASDDIAADIAHLQSHGVRMIDERPRQGAHGTLIAFLHPSSSGKVLTELCQHQGATHEH
ncbi:MAG: methylmalonyl-CoA epimerase [candidate division KSB1 bacterium]|nr:methylmalonyl-CoA epimerase [candidate division KSB1 bacterium]